MGSGALSSDAVDRIDPADRTGYNGGRLAATVLLVRDGRSGLEVWMQERVSTMPNYPGMTVFPGGGVDPRDFPPRSWDSGDLWAGPSVVAVARKMGVTKYKAHALLFAAVREMFEETGTLLAVENTGEVVADASYLHDERKQLATHRKALTDVLAKHDLKVRSDLVKPWARWVGVSESGNWFDTFSFIAAAPAGQNPDGDTSEADDANWFPPSLLLDGWRHGLVRFVLATWAQLAELTEYETVSQVMVAADAADLNPVIGHPVSDPRFEEYFTDTPVDRIGKRRGF